MPPLKTGSKTVKILQNDCAASLNIYIVEYIKLLKEKETPRIGEWVVSEWVGEWVGD